ncbi:hypothetical protein KNO15_08935 [Leifsonia shinshuensis]|uniref:hypothetical protein n=1 Tax=Leifsonia shinshuensis TaxID=150026 RepID=UPI001F508E0E|nr:hypothetical protein [Leifsonia shinshuensis]MCI0156820.1 hypothetical protein [Leifsonia shinshuensis]
MMTTTLRTPIHLRQKWQIELGPYLLLDELARQLHVPASRVRELAVQKEILEVHDARGTILYPVFALADASADSTGYRVLPKLRCLLEVLARSCEEEWLWALWVSGWNPRHHGSAPIDALLQGDESVLAAARNEDWSWTAHYF